MSQRESRKVSKGQFFALAAWQGEGKLARMEAKVFVHMIWNLKLQLKRSLLGIITIITRYLLYCSRQGSLVRFMPLTPRNAMRKSKIIATGDHDRRSPVTSLPLAQYSVPSSKSVIFHHGSLWAFATAFVFFTIKTPTSTPFVGSPLW